MATYLPDPLHPRLSAAGRALAAVGTDAGSAFDVEGDVAEAVLGLAGVTIPASHVGVAHTAVAIQITYQLANPAEKRVLLEEREGEQARTYRFPKGDFPTVDPYAALLADQAVAAAAQAGAATVAADPAAGWYRLRSVR